MSICINCGKKLNSTKVAYCKNCKEEDFYHKKWHHDVFGGIEKRDDWEHC